MKLRLLERFRRSREKHRIEYLEQEPQREETKRIKDHSEDDVVEGRSPSMSRLKRW